MIEQDSGWRLTPFTQANPKPASSWRAANGRSVSRARMRTGRDGTLLTQRNSWS